MTTILNASEERTPLMRTQVLPHAGRYVAPRIKVDPMPQLVPEVDLGGPPSRLPGWLEESLNLVESDDDAAAATAACVSRTELTDTDLTETDIASTAVDLDGLTERDIVRYGRPSSRGRLRTRARPLHRRRARNRQRPRSRPPSGKAPIRRVRRHASRDTGEVVAAWGIVLAGLLLTGGVALLL